MFDYIKNYCYFIVTHLLFIVYYNLFILISYYITFYFILLFYYYCYYTLLDIINNSYKLSRIYYCYTLNTYLSSNNYLDYLFLLFNYLYNYYIRIFNLSIYVSELDWLTNKSYSLFYDWDINLLNSVFNSSIYTLYFTYSF